MRIILLAGATLLSIASARANVVALSDIGFAARNSVDVNADPATVYALLVAPARWWSAAHTYSGSAANMTIDAKAGGCFCETVPAKDGHPAGSVEHARVVYAAPGKALRLSGALGPLQSEGLTGTLDFTLTPVAGGRGTTITMTYVVGGYARTPMSQLAPMVDKVMAEQLQGLQHAADKK
jgi:uncharacterized protein YndB with AHSA1/START domain